MRARDRAGRVLVFPNQTPGLIERFGLIRAQVDLELWAVDRGGRRWSGAAAVNRTLRELGGIWGWIGAAYRFPPLGWLENRGYRWVAVHRSLISRFLGAPPEWDD